MDYPDSFKVATLCTYVSHDKVHTIVGHELIQMSFTFNKFNGVLTHYYQQFIKKNNCLEQLVLYQPLNWLRHVRSKPI